MTLAAGPERGPSPLVVLADPGALDRFAQTWSATAAYFARVASGRLGHHDRLVGAPMLTVGVDPGIWRSGTAKGGLGRPPNSQTVVETVVGDADRLGLLTGLPAARLVVVAPAETGYRPHAWRLRGGGHPLPRRAGQRPRLDRYAIVDADVGVGALAHELGHLVFDWPDHHRTGCGANCLMGTGGSAAAPAWPCAPLRVAAGWLTPRPVALDSTRQDLADGVVGAHRDLLIEAGPAQTVVVHRRGRRPITAPVEAGQSLVAAIVRAGLTPAQVG